MHTENKNETFKCLALRPYQSDCLTTILKHYKDGVRRQLVSIATGGGKTVIFSHLIREFNKPTLILAHTNELLEQAEKKIKMICPDLDIGIVNGSRKETNTPVVIASVQSARQPNTLKKLVSRNFGLLIADEAHHFAANTMRDIVKSLGFSQDENKLKLLVGFTATPFRQDGRGLGEVFEEIVFEKSIGSLINEGYLCQPKGVRVTTDLDLREVAQSRGDYSSKGMYSVMGSEELLSLTLRAYQEHAENRQTICFTCNINHAQRLEYIFKSESIPSATIHGKLPKEERKRLLSEFEEGKIKVLFNCQVLTEGFDSPEISCVIVARPTSSKGLYQQMIGRGLRRFPQKNDCIVIDFNDRNMSLCNSTILLPNTEEKIKQEKELKNREHRILKELPDNLNKSLKCAYVTNNLLGDSFNWVRDGNNFYLRGLQHTEVRIEKEGSSYKVIHKSFLDSVKLSEELSFEYAFSTAEDFARNNKKDFILTDREASWRTLPATVKQINMFRSKGYKCGLEKLTRGQASDLIGSGALRRR